MVRSITLVAAGLWAAGAPVWAQESQRKAAKPSTMAVQDLADWIDARFGEEYARAGAKPADAVDDATFLRRISLDLQGRIPSVAQVRDFVADKSEYKRSDYVEKLLSDGRTSERFAQRSAEHLGRVWRRMMIPASAPGAAMAPQLDPWLAQQFAANTPYDDFARKLLLVPPRGPVRGFGLQPATAPTADPDSVAGVFQQAVGAMPENLASAYVRVFLGVRLNCAQCHDHPMADWKRADFWGIAALLASGPADRGRPNPTIKPGTESVTYPAKLLWVETPVKAIPADKSPREYLADWMVSAENPNFAATAVNRVWQYLCGRGLAGSVDDLDRVSTAERKVLDGLSKLFVESRYDVRWLIAGVCRSKVYQQEVAKESEAAAEADTFRHRPLKTLIPEQVFDSLEQSLGLPVARADNGPRFNGDREQFVARLNEAAAEAPADYKGGIPQALMLMNGKLTADATSLENSRTLRAVVEAPFLQNEDRLETLYLAALSRKPHKEELDVLLKHVESKSSDEERKQAFAEIFWGLLNSPEFVLSR
jgi:hypothetical protein